MSEELLDQLAEKLYAYEFRFWIDAYPKNGTREEKVKFFKRFYQTEREL